MLVLNVQRFKSIGNSSLVDADMLYISYSFASSD